MEANHKKILKAISLELRHLLEGYYDSDGKWQPGDLEQRLAAIGVRRDRDPVPVDELGHLSDDDKNARTVVDAYLQVRDEADVSREEAVAEFVRETAYTWANRLLCLRCMEARELVDEVILQKEAYGGRSLEHHRLAQREPEACSGEDDGLFAVLENVFTNQTEHLPLLFDPQSPGVALKPSPAVLKRCLALLSGIEAVRPQQPATGEVFQAPDALGWAYQYWNTEEKDRVFETVRTKKGAKIAGADIIPATQLYTEPYMVKFLVQNSLGATWMGMHPDSKLYEKWEYYVRDADRTPVEKKPVAELTFLDPACGSGHFLLEAFDLYYDMYIEEGELTEPDDICRLMLEKNLFGIDIDARAVQIAEAALWMKAAERAFDFQGAATNLVAAVASHLKGDLWEEFLADFEREPSVARVLRKFGQAMDHVDELGSLARPEEELRAIIHEEHATWERQIREREEANYLFPEMTEDVLSGQLPFHEVSDDEFGERLLYRARAAIDGFTVKAREQGGFQDQYLGRETSQGFKLLEVLSRHYEVVAANPPYMGSKNLSPSLKNCVEQYYSSGKRDLYASFMLRCGQLCTHGGRTAVVAPQSWMFLKSFGDLRAGGDSENGNFLQAVTFEVLAQLGRHAFSEVDPPSNVTLVVWSDAAPETTHEITCFRVSSSRPSQEQSALLRQGTTSLRNDHRYRVCQRRFLSIPSSPICFWLSDTFFDLLLRTPLASSADVRQGLATTDNPRFIRYIWEAPYAQGRWFPYVKGGGYKKWIGFEHLVVDWGNDGARVKEVILRDPTTNSWSRRVSAREYYFRPGVTYTLVARGGFGVRLLDAGSIFDVSGTSIFPHAHDDRLLLSAICNTRLSNFLLRVITQSLSYHAGYVARLPIPSITNRVLLTELAQTCCGIKAEIVGWDVAERRFEGVKPFRQRLAVSASLLTVEAVIESVISRDAGLGCEDVRYLFAETGAPAGLLPLIQGYDNVSALARECSPLPEAADTFLDAHTREDLTSERLADVKETLRQMYESGVGKPIDLAPDSQRNEEDEVPAVGGLIPVLPESLLEELSQAIGYHPLSVFSLVKHGIEKDGWRCDPEERQVLGDQHMVLALHLLGHCWPKQIEAEEPVLEWADPDGIIPLTEGTDESTLLERVRERITAEFEGGDVASVEREFAEIMGKPLDKWLTMEFFKHHTKQFKKRPIAWQIQSGKFTARKKPAFACLVYYHKLDGDLLPKICNQYVGPLRSRLETELRSIENVSADTRSDRQEGRRGELQDQIDELRDFDATLQKVITEGFTSKELTKIVKDEPLDKWRSLDGIRLEPESQDALLQQESRYFPDINDGVRVNIAPLQKAGLLAADVVAKKDLDKAIADRAQWRADECRWCREDKLPQPGWWPEKRRGTTNTQTKGAELHQGGNT